MTKCNRCDENRLKRVAAEQLVREHSEELFRLREMIKRASEVYELAMADDDSDGWETCHEIMAEFVWVTSK